MKNTTGLIIKRTNVNCCEKMRIALKAGYIVESKPELDGDFEKLYLTIPQLTVQRKMVVGSNNTDPPNLYHCPFCGVRISQKLEVKEVEEETEVDSDVTPK